MTPPCYKCPHRHEGCHAECEDYKRYGAERERIRRERAKMDSYWGFTREGQQRRKKAMKNERRKK